MTKKQEGITSASLESIDITGIDWIIPGIVPEGMLIALVGQAQSGKSTFAAAVCAHVTGGKPLLGECGEPAKVAWLTKEESLSQIVAPRLLSAGCKVNRVLFPGMDNSGKRTHAMTLPSAIDDLERFVRKEGVRFLFFDPIRSFLDAGIDPNGDELGVRSMMEQLIAMAERTKATIGVTLHHRKSKSGSALDWISGSSAWGQTCRVMIQFAKHQDGERNILSFAKFSIGPCPPSRWFSFERSVHGVAFSLGEESHATAEDAADGAMCAAEIMEMQDGLTWMIDYLSARRRESKETWLAWQAQGFSKAKYWKARKELGVTWHREGVQGEEQRTYLELPKTQEK